MHDVAAAAGGLGADFARAVRINRCVLASIRGAVAARGAASRYDVERAAYRSVAIVLDLRVADAAAALGLGFGAVLFGVDRLPLRRRGGSVGGCGFSRAGGRLGGGLLACAVTENGRGEVSRDRMTETHRGWRVHGPRE